MPVSKGAEKKLRKDIKRTQANGRLKRNLKKVLKTARANPTEEAVRLAFQNADKAAKKHLIHKNKAARMKSVLSKLLVGKDSAKSQAKVLNKPAKKSTKKTVKKTR